MELDPNATSDLTAFFTKRFPAPEDRQALARAAHIAFREPELSDPDIAWGGLVTRAREQSALPRLARCAARKRPDDENLQGVAAVLSGRAWPPQRQSTSSSTWKQLGTLGVLVGVASVAWAASGPDKASIATTGSSVESASIAIEEPAALSTTSPQTVLPSDAGTPSVEPASTAPTAAASSAAEQGSDRPSGAALESTPASTALPSDPTPDPVGSDLAGAGSAERIAPATAPEEQVFIGCSGEPGELVGYWYAGRESPGSKGDLIKVPRDLNVRADYPDRHNNYDRRAKINCTLGVGQNLVLTADPIRVPGDAYWVPLHATRRR
ncbi:MAG: hypothetical protein CL927_03395 [Deltaproteobacteria bacterium]|nr:hypothetical protein [Deltaproteobacteria bacterium]HCH63793.1 hypothetical protein [Deltaproteobacteria bacterium]